MRNLWVTELRVVGSGWRWAITVGLSVRRRGGLQYPWQVIILRLMAGAQVDTASATAIRRALVRWYDRHRRRLPWRRANPDPYLVLVSETMLQQTQVATVIDYYRRFIEAFPTVGALADADERQVLRLWQGLGYYRRARHLHQAAKQIVAEFRGRVPADAATLLCLPGVGRYTAGAVASIAFDRPEPVLDGNVSRVLSRWFAIRTPIDEPATNRLLWDLARRVVPRSRPGRFNQAMMELGALICTARRPRCHQCPVASRCRVGMTDEAELLPARAKKRAPRPVTHHVLAIRRRGRYIFEKRDGDGLWSHMWQLPTAEGLGTRPGPKGVASWLLRHRGLDAMPPARVGQFTHKTTHRTIGFVLWQVDSPRGRLPADAVWRRLDRVDDLPLANPQRHALSLLGERHEGT